MTNYSAQTSFRKAALIAGLAYLFMATAPFAEFLVYQKLIIPGNAAETSTNIIANKTLFVSGIFGYFITFISDVVIACALYILLKQVNKNLSLFTAWCRLIYAVISIVALLNLFTVLRLLDPADYLTVFSPDQLHAQVMLSLTAFREGWSIGFIFFDFHLLLLGYLVYKSAFIPKFVGLLLMVAGLGWLITNLQPFLFPHVNFGWLMISSLGELVFVIWLFAKGIRLKETE